MYTLWYRGAKLIKIRKQNKFITADEVIKLYYEWKFWTDFIIFDNIFFRSLFFYRKKYLRQSFFSLAKNKFDGFFVS